MTYDEIINSINSGETKLFEVNPLMKINKNLTNFHRFQFSIALTDPSMSSFGLNVEQSTFSIIRSEISQELNKRALKGIFNTVEFEYLDLRDSVGINNHQNARRLYDLIMSCKEDYKNIISTGMICAALRDLVEFVPSSPSTEYRGAQPYETGQISGLSVWVDPFMSFDDGRMILFYDVEINIRNIKASMQPQPSFTPRLLLDYEIALNVGDSKLIFLIDEMTLPSFQRHQSLLRDIKINDILDEKS